MKLPRIVLMHSPYYVNKSLAHGDRQQNKIQIDIHLLVINENKKLMNETKVA